MYYTNFKRDDGFGAIFQNIIFDILYTEYHGNTFVYTPIPAIDHNYTNDPNFTSKLEDFMNIKEAYKCPDNIDKTRIITYPIISTYPFIEKNINEMFSSESFKKLKNIFYKDKKTPFNNSYMNICIHIRRPNSRDTRLTGSDTPDAYYLNKINIIRKTYKDKPLQFHIYSQGNEHDFEIYKNNDTVFHLNESIEDTFLGLVYGDILVMSRSSFSYVAGLLSNSIVHYEKFWHPPLYSWIM
jgi:hypothetical protein